MIHLDSFSGAVADLKPAHRDSESVLQTLSKNPTVSTWDMSELLWLRSAISDLKKRGLIVSKDEPFPWLRYELTDAGKQLRAREIS